MFPTLRTVSLLVLAATSGSVPAARPHEHGVARLDVAVEATRVTLMLELPLESLLGFERAPRSETEKAAAAAAVARLREAARLFAIDPAAGCQPVSAELRSGALGLGGAAPGAEGHEDLDAEYEFACKDGSRAAFVDTGLFDALPRLQRVDVQTVTRKGQTRATLRRPSGRLPLAR